MKDQGGIRNHEKDVENQHQQYTALTNNNNTSCDEQEKDNFETVHEEWVTLGASYVCSQKLLLVIYSAFIVLTIYNTVDVVRNRHEGE